jgi:hypothetical protein
MVNVRFVVHYGKGRFCCVYSLDFSMKVAYMVLYMMVKVGFVVFTL